MIRVRITTEREYGNGPHFRTHYSVLEGSQHNWKVITQLGVLTGQRPGVYVVNGRNVRRVGDA